MNTRFWTKDWFVGLVVTLFFLFSANTLWIQGLERIAYDYGVRSGSRQANDNIAVIAIDDESINNIGRWPWSRDIHAQMLHVLTQAQAKVIGHLVLFVEPQIDAGLTNIQQLHDDFSTSNLYNQTPVDANALGFMITDLKATLETLKKSRYRTKRTIAEQLLKQVNALEQYYQQSSLSVALIEELEQFKTALDQAEVSLKTDQQLATAIATAHNVVLGMYFNLGNPLGNADELLPDYVLSSSLDAHQQMQLHLTEEWSPYSAISAMPPIAELGKVSTAVGHTNAYPDVDGGIRSEPLILEYFHNYLPSMSLQIAALSLNLQSRDIKIDSGQGIQLGRLHIPTDEHFQMQTYFYAQHNGKSAFTVDSFFDVMSGKISPSKYKNKIVLIGTSAVGVGTPQLTPVASLMPPVLALAHSVSSILNEDFFIIPRWGFWAEAGVFLFITVYLMWLLPRLNAGLAAALTVGLLLILLISFIYLMVEQTLWLKLMLPTSLLVIGHLVLTTKRFLITEKSMLVADEKAAESYRLLGLQHQGEGKLDMAFDNFLKCPLNNNIMDNLYYLALDFERKRQYNKANAIYTHMSGYNPQFRDISQRSKQTLAMENTVVLGGSANAGATLIMDGNDFVVEKPNLGRYQIEKELGKGSMGVVYLGRDPKINRVVAIKTMALSEEFEGNELDDVKARFFREAESAGRLAHPHIVTIFDAGEEHDLAYIAMEFLKGHDLLAYTKAENKLSETTVLKLMIQAAEALDYAHQQHIVHRDIKPANIMYDPDTESIKITDFGIARITDSSKTKTGIVMGTPSYMSPEQIAGKKIDGRSDLYSLGVMFFQLISSQLPFKNKSMATLMYQITNESPTDILDIQPDLSPCIKKIIDKSMTKELNIRYQRGKEMADDLRQCLQNMTH